MGSGAGDGGVAAGELLLRFTEAVAGDDPSLLADVRAEVVAELGPDVLVDAAGVISAFEMMNRVGNATGTPLDAPIVEQTEGIRAELPINEYRSRHLETGSGD